MTVPVTVYSFVGKSDISRLLIQNVGKRIFLFFQESRETNLYDCKRKQKLKGIQFHESKGEHRNAADNVFKWIFHFLTMSNLLVAGKNMPFSHSSVYNSFTTIITLLGTRIHRYD